MPPEQRHVWPGCQPAGWSDCVGAEAQQGQPHTADGLAGGAAARGDGGKGGQVGGGVVEGLGLKKVIVMSWMRVWR